MSKTIQINNDAINTAISLTSKSSTNLQSTVAGNLPGVFSVLSDLGLYSNGLTAISKQVALVIENHEILAALLSSHLDSVSSHEDDLSRAADSKFGNYLAEAEGDGDPSHGIEIEGIEEIEPGSNVTPEYLLENIPKINDENLGNIIKLLETLKSEDVSLMELLFDPEKASILFLLLRNILGDKSEDLEGISDEDFASVQRALIDAIISEKVELPDINDNPFLITSVYLAKISKEKNIKPSELFFLEENKSILKTALLDLYDGNEIEKYDLSDKTITDFREYIDKIAMKNNKTYVEVLTDHLDLVI